MRARHAAAWLAGLGLAASATVPCTAAAQAVPSGRPGGTPQTQTGRASAVVAPPLDGQVNEARQTAKIADSLARAADDRSKKLQASIDSVVGSARQASMQSWIAFGFGFTGLAASVVLGYLLLSRDSKKSSPIVPALADAVPKAQPERVPSAEELRDIVREVSREQVKQLQRDHEERIKSLEESRAAAPRAAEIPSLATPAPAREFAAANQRSSKERAWNSANSPPPVDSQRLPGKVQDNVVISTPSSSRPMVEISWRQGTATADVSVNPDFKFTAITADYLRSFFDIEGTTEGSYETIRPATVLWSPEAGTGSPQTRGRIRATGV